MALRNTSMAFGSMARVLHWGMALLIIVSLALIESQGFAPEGSALRAGVAGLACAGRARRVRADLVPAVLASSSTRSPRSCRRRRRGSVRPHAVEWTFYALMVVLPVLGILMMQADGKTVSLLGISLPTMVAVDKPWAHRIEGVHEWLGNAMMVLIGLHVAATLWHGVVLRDNTLARMR